MSNPSDVRETFPTTEDLAGSGVPLTAMQAGQATAAANGEIAFAFQDVNGNAVLPQLNNLGQLPVTTANPGARLRAYGRNLPNAALSSGPGGYSNMFVIASIAAATGNIYTDFAGKVSGRRDSYLELIYQDGANTVILDSTILGPGQFTAPIGLGPSEDTFSVPASAVAPVFQIRGGNFSTLSDLHAVLTLTEF